MEILSWFSQTSNWHAEKNPSTSTRPVSKQPSSGLSMKLLVNAHSSLGISSDVELRHSGAKTDSASGHSTPFIVESSVFWSFANSAIFSAELAAERYVGILPSKPPHSPFILPLNVFGRMIWACVPSTRISPISPTLNVIVTRTPPRLLGCTEYKEARSNPAATSASLSCNSGANCNQIIILNIVLAYHRQVPCPYCFYKLKAYLSWPNWSWFNSTTRKHGRWMREWNSESVRYDFLKEWYEIWYILSIRWIDHATTAWEQAWSIP